MEARQVSSKLKVRVLSVEPLSAPSVRTSGNCLILLQCHQVRSPSNARRSFILWAALHERLSGVLSSSFTLPAARPGDPASAAGTPEKLVLPSSLSLSDERYAIPTRVAGVTLNSVPRLNPHASPSTDVLFWPSTFGPTGTGNAPADAAAAE